MRQAAVRTVSVGATLMRVDPAQYDRIAAGCRGDLVRLVMLASGLIADSDRRQAEIALIGFLKSDRPDTVAAIAALAIVQLASVGTMRVTTGGEVILDIKTPDQLRAFGEHLMRMADSYE